MDFLEFLPCGGLLNEIYGCTDCVINKDIFRGVRKTFMFELMLGDGLEWVRVDFFGPSSFRKDNLKGSERIRPIIQVVLTNWFWPCFFTYECTIGMDESIRVHVYVRCGHICFKDSARCLGM